MSATARNATLHELEAWLAYPPVAGSFDEGELEGPPDPVRRYLRTSIAAGTSCRRGRACDAQGVLGIRRRAGSRWRPEPAESIRHRATRQVARLAAWSARPSSG
jgi:hypothetical protein